MDTLDFIMRLEGCGDELTEEETVEGVQALIDSGMAWQLQGSYGRMAQAFIDAGYCTAVQA